jgi:diguanylate cyclase (GGDEF)-like protein
MVPTTVTIRRQYLKIYLLILITVGSGFGFTFYKQYSDWVQVTKSDLLRNARITNVAVDAILVDATKLLDIDKAKISEGIDSGAITDKAAYKILSNSRNVFSSFVSNESLLLTLYIDENGLVRATTESDPKTHVDLSDRLYFQSLRKNPNLSFAIGNLVKAKTTGLLTFHIALPIIDSEGAFRGVVAQQVLANEVTEVLDGSLGSDIPSQVLVQLNGGDVAFAYPKPAIQNKADIERNMYINEKITADGNKYNVIEIPSSPAIAQASYVGYVTSRAYGYRVSATISKQSVLAGFIWQHVALIAYCLLAFIILTLGLLRFYKHAIKMSATLMMSFTDGLTKIKNRRGFDIEFPRLWKDAMRSQQPISALFIDIDHFKIFNDEYGHECGDIALIEVARAISKCITRPLDLCCRWGGEEFAVVLPETDVHGAILLANSILTSVRAIKLNFPCEHQPTVTVSIGIASARVSEKNMTDDLIDMADKAMYKAKQSGRDRYAVYGESNS